MSKKKVRILHNLKLNEVSLVTNPANPDAHVHLVKFADDDVNKSAFNEILNEMEIEEKIRDVIRPMWGLSDVLMSAFYRIMQDDSLSMDQKKKELKASINEFASKFKQSLDEIKIDKSTASSGSVTKEESEMDEKKLQELIAKAVEAANGKLDVAAITAIVKDAVSAALTDKDAQIRKLQAEASLTAEQKAYYDKLSDVEKEAFLKLDAKKRDAEVKKASDSDETVEIEGRIVRKSVVGDDLFYIMKSQSDRLQTQEEMVRKEREARELAEFEKIAKDEYSNLPGTDAEKAKVLKFMSICDPGVKTTLETIMKAANEGLKIALFTEKGHQGHGGDETPELKLSKMAMQIMGGGGNLTYEQAYEKACETPEGRSLYAQSRMKRAQ